MPTALGQLVIPFGGGTRASLDLRMALFELGPKVSVLLS